MAAIPLIGAKSAIASNDWLGTSTGRSGLNLAAQLTREFD
jgi:hypothetical protein